MPAPVIVIMTIAVLAWMAMKWGLAYVLLGLRGFWPSTTAIIVGVVVVLATALLNRSRDREVGKSRVWMFYAAGFILAVSGELALYYALTGCC